ncbi:ChaN family lipoprotein [Marinobacter sp. V034]|uniref:ChaN family lipoprotein n=1 Tax=Marinobacter sp. V034 TaxID=3459610 RepID=UPI0040445E01
MIPLKHLLTGILAGLMTACASTQNPDPDSDMRQLTGLYDYRIIDPDTDKTLSVTALADQWQDADVIIIGEFHGHNGAHLLEAQLQSALYKLRPNQVLSMEQFTVDHQTAVDRYLAGETGEEELIKEGAAWNNYKASYRPLVAFAADHHLPVVGANAPADMARCVGREGKQAIDGISADKQQWLPTNPLFSPPGYRERFFGAMGGHHGNTGDPRLENSYLAQLLRDNTMATSIERALAEQPGDQVIHLTGTFHSEGRSGTVAALLHRSPSLNIKVLSPVIADDPRVPALEKADRVKGDAVYLLYPLPDEYKSDDARNAAIAERFKQAPQPACD